MPPFQASGCPWSPDAIPEFNGGTARTNPSHEADLAAACVDTFEKPSGYEPDIGGPDALTRREIAALAWKAIGKEARAVRVPVSVLRNAGRLMKPFNPRVGNLFLFIAEILIDDFVAPLYGTRHISDYFDEKAREMRRPQGRDGADTAEASAGG